MTVWNCLVRVLSSGGFVLSETLTTDLKREVQNYLLQERTDLEIILVERADKHQGPHYDTSLLEAYEHALKKSSAEIDLWILNQQRIAEAASSSRAETPTTISVHGPVGAIQTGPGATASVAITSSDDRKTIIEAVERALEDVSGAADPPFNKEEVLEILEDVRLEALKNQPNGIRLRSLLGTAASALSTVSSLNSAYQALKGVASLVGITFSL